MTAKSAALYRASAIEKPRLRGRLHAVCSVLAVPAAIVLVALGDTLAERFAAGVFGFGMFFMFYASALFHRTDFDDHGWYRFRRIDHTAIFLCIATGATPFGMLSLEGWAQKALLLSAWLGIAGGLTMRWLTFDPPYGLMNTTYIAVSWASVVTFPQLWDALGPGGGSLVIAGGVLYTIGALIVGSRWPDPWPTTFGYHEIWHVLVTVAISLHYLAVAIYVL